MKAFNLSHMSAGFAAVFVGYTSSVAIVIHAATQLGASSELIESWLMMLGLVLGVTSIGYSWHYKRPMLMAWSTPGAVLLALASESYALPVVVGAFAISGIMIALTGLIKPISNVMSRIPSSLGTAMLAAILLPFCLQAFEPLDSYPAVFMLMFISYMGAKFLVPKYTMLVLLILGLLCAQWIGTDSKDISFTLSSPVWITPQAELGAMVSLALPLYVVTMLSQNLPGIAMMKGYGYQTPIQSTLVGTGAFNALTAPMGVFSINLAAISAAMCMNEDVDKDASQRFKAVIWAGVFYIFAGLFASSVVALFLLLPVEIIKMLAGFALLGTLLMCLSSAFSDAKYRESALLTFLFTLSGATVLGISATLVGLLVGIVHLRLTQR
ncbi:benzoate/H(+) symporter BenE family transporter [Vibrio sp. SCSIO 43136]|uniref:benzoate/H(+) symporter BenE family transporter n=1 Tax=Vibrio sp. SCSIO 43136 TaxID=2819101 RepID=UPI00207608F0|nr:benzoate/H(+) symporter BenE family transporter [Vibrio sp. SCSIO 43136]USD67236.1 benzoate/H(+) symporter BenE family transporter [Vibrio sp. SCSIO 43136]